MTWKLKKGNKHTSRKKEHIVWPHFHTHHQCRLLVGVRLYDVGHLVVERQVKLELCLVWTARESQHHLPQLHWTVALIHVQVCGWTALIRQPVCYLTTGRQNYDGHNLLIYTKDTVQTMSCAYAQLCSYAVKCPSWFATICLSLSITKQRGSINRFTLLS